jgi:hypothetical protein
LRVYRYITNALDLRFRQFAIGRRQVKLQGDKEMNHLNSCLIEGIVSGGLNVSGEGAERTGVFLMISTGVRRIEGNLTPYETRLRVVLRSKGLLDGAVNGAKDQRRIRIVGRLLEDGDGLYLDAEHTEYCAIADKNGEVEKPFSVHEKD